MSATVDFGPWRAETSAAAAADRAPARTWMALAAMLGGLAVGSSAFALNLLRVQPPATVTVRLGGVSLAVPSGYFRSQEEVGEGPRARLDLLLSWPDLGPLQQRSRDARRAWPDGPAPSQGDAIMVTLAPSDDGPAPETRVSQVYARFLEAPVLQGPGDLLTRHFKKTSPYAGEVLVFSPPDGRKAAARCESEAFRLDPALQAGMEAGAPAEIPATCIAEIRRRGLDIQFRFEPRLAGGLEAVQRRLAALVDRMVR